MKQSESDIIDEGFQPLRKVSATLLSASLATIDAVPVAHEHVMICNMKSTVAEYS
jgi:hypothetical protein